MQLHKFYLLFSSRLLWFKFISPGDISIFFMSSWRVDALSLFRWYIQYAHFVIRLFSYAKSVMRWREWWKVKNLNYDFIFVLNIAMAKLLFVTFLTWTDNETYFKVEIAISSVFHVFSEFELNSEILTEKLTTICSC